MKLVPVAPAAAVDHKPAALDATLVVKVGSAIWPTVRQRPQTTCHQNVASFGKCASMGYITHATSVLTVADSAANLFVSVSVMFFSWIFEPKSRLQQQQSHRQQRSSPLRTRTNDSNCGHESHVRSRGQLAPRFAGDVLQPAHSGKDDEVFEQNMS